MMMPKRIELLKKVRLVIVKSSRRLRLILGANCSLLGWRIRMCALFYVGRRFEYFSFSLG